MKSHSYLKSYWLLGEGELVFFREGSPGRLFMLHNPTLMHTGSTK